MTEQDVPSPINLCDPRDAREWERTAPERPGRPEIFQQFGRELLALGKSDISVLELGSGPGFLAAYLLEVLPAARLTLLDFSAPMHDLARARLAAHKTRVDFVERSFREPGWSQGLGPFDAVITNQAVHELHFTFLVDIGAQEPKLGHDPEFSERRQILAEVAWLTLEEIPERDRAFLWAGGLLGVSQFTRIVESWGGAVSCPEGHDE